jgi:transcriptional regulator with XRE-family HTH domain
VGAALWRLVEKFQDEQTFRPSVRAIAKQAGIPPSTLANWKHITKLPNVEHLQAFARVSHYTTSQLLQAALEDYLAGGGDGAPTNLVVLPKREHDALTRAARRGTIERSEADDQPNG